MEKPKIYMEPIRDENNEIAYKISRTDNAKLTEYINQLEKQLADTNALKAISAEISALEAARDFGDITPEDVETLAVLNLCYDLLTRTRTRTRAAQALTMPTPPEMIEPGFEDAETPVYGVSYSPVADFAFAMCTRSGRINLREVMRSAMPARQNGAIAAKAGIRRATISNYLNNVKSMTCDNFEKVIAACFE